MGIEGIVVGRVVQAVLQDRPGVFNVNTQPHDAGAAGVGRAPALVSHTAEKVLVLVDVQGHPLQDVQ